MSDITSEIKKRRTFAIISHPDAGKTTLTEKFLLYGGAINLAGSVKGKKTAKHAVSDLQYFSLIMMDIALIFLIHLDTKISQRILIELLWLLTQP